MKSIINIFLVVCLSIFGISTISGQSSFYHGGGAHALTLANCGSMFTGIEAAYANPAGMVDVDHYSFDVSYDRRFNLSELATVSLAGVKKIGRGAIGLAITRYGYSAYSEQKISLRYARSLWSNVSVGGAFNYLGFYLNQYGNANRFTFEVGVQSKVNKKLSIGAYVFGPESVSLTSDQDIPSRFALGMTYRASRKALIYIDISKIINRNPEYKFAVDYEMAKYLSVRVGANFTQSSLHFGPVVHLKNGLSILGAYTFDNRLGHTTGFSLTWDLDIQKK